jgi:hypothetical protein
MDLLFCPKPAVNASRLLFQDRTNDFNRALSALKNISTGDSKHSLGRILSNQFVETVFAEPKHDAPDVAPEDRPGTHGAGLCARVDCAKGEMLGCEDSGCVSNEVEFSVPRDISFCNNCVFRFQEDFLFWAHQQSAKGVIPVFSGLPGKFDRFLGIFQVWFFHLRSFLLAGGLLEIYFATS